jgi:pimeloyl-ACP methyl ester carboxylesterase
MVYGPVLNTMEDGEVTITGPYPASDLPDGVRSRFVEDVNGLTMHVLEAGHENGSGDAERPCLLLLHGFPELAYSWRKIMGPLAAAGYHVIAPDQRGYGHTTGWDGDYDGDLGSFRFLNLVRDMVALLSALGRRDAVAVIGHDFGSSVAAYCALARPDMFGAMVLMSAPFAGPPAFPFGPVDAAPATPTPDIHAALAALTRPRKHYQRYYSTRPANADMWKCPQGVHDFLRAYCHHKSADWPGNTPYPLDSWTAAELAKMPTYYVMDKGQTMAEVVAPHMPGAEEIARCEWLPDDELRVYAQEFGRTGFQGGLQWYRCATSEEYSAELRLFAGRTIDIPSCFIAGASDWGAHQKPGVFDAMATYACTRMAHRHLIDGAGHWVQQEQPGAVARLLLEFLADAKVA